MISINRYYALMLLLFISSPFSTFAQGVSMSPTRLFFSGNPGETVQKAVILSNSSNKDYSFNVELKDWKRENDGNKVYFESGSLDKSNAAWVSTQQSTVKLPAKDKVGITVYMKIPEDASSSEVTNSMLFFTQIGKQEDKSIQQQGIGIITLIEFGLHVYYTPPSNNDQSLAIDNIEEIQPADKESSEVAVTINNDGDLISDAEVKFELTNTQSGAETKLKPVNISMMPGAVQTVKFSVPSDLEGKFLGVSIIEIENSNDLSVGEKSFEF